MKCTGYVTIKISYKINDSKNIALIEILFPVEAGIDQLLVNSSIGV